MKYTTYDISPLVFFTSSTEIAYWCKTCCLCLNVSSMSFQRFDNTNYCTPPSSLYPSFSNWEPLVHTGDPERPISPWAGRPSGSGTRCADSGSVNRADGFWQIHSDWKSFILKVFFLSLFSCNPHTQKELSVYLLIKHSGVTQFVPWLCAKQL